VANSVLSLSMMSFGSPVVPKVGLIRFAPDRGLTRIEAPAAGAAA
jgi:hypothetical protein